MSDFQLIVIALNCCEKGQEDVCDEEYVHNAIKDDPWKSCFVTEGHSEGNHDCHVDQPPGNDEIPSLLPFSIRIDDASGFIDIVDCYHFIVNSSL